MEIDANFQDEKLRADGNAAKLQIAEQSCTEAVTKLQRSDDDVRDLQVSDLCSLLEVTSLAY